MSAQPLTPLDSSPDTPEKQGNSTEKIVIASGVSADEYLRRERLAETRNEFHDGDIVAMAGASEAHNLLTMNASALLWNALRGSPCRVFANDMKVRLVTANRYYYPDVVAVCSSQNANGNADDAAHGVTTSPTLIVEVLSPSTEVSDRGEKFQNYRQIPTLREYVLVAQDQVSVERFVRHENTDLWTYSQVTGTDAVVTLESLDESGITLPLAEIYEKVQTVS